MHTIEQQTAENILAKAQKIAAISC